jgi:hypothetical protein
MASPTSGRAASVTENASEKIARFVDFAGKP